MLGLLAVKTSAFSEIGNVQNFMYEIVKSSLKCASERIKLFLCNLKRCFVAPTKLVKLTITQKEILFEYNYINVFICMITLG